MVETGWVLIRITGRVGNSETQVMGFFVDEDAIDDFLERLYGVTEDKLDTNHMGSVIEYFWQGQYSDHYATLTTVYN